HEKLILDHHQANATIENLSTELQNRIRNSEQNVIELVKLFESMIAKDESVEELQKKFDQMNAVITSLDDYSDYSDWLESKLLEQNQGISKLLVSHEQLESKYKLTNLELKKTKEKLDLAEEYFSKCGKIFSGFVVICLIYFYLW